MPGSAVTAAATAYDQPNQLGLDSDNGPSYDDDARRHGNDAVDDEDDAGDDNDRNDGRQNGRNRFAVRCQDQLADTAESATSRHDCMQVLTKGSPAKKPNLMTHSHTVTGGLGLGAELRVRRENSRRECRDCRDSGVETTSLLLQNNLSEVWLPIEHLQRGSVESKESPATHKSMSFLPLVHERQTERMRTRSEWFLNPGPKPEAESGNSLTAANSLTGSPTKSLQVPSARVPLMGLSCRAEENITLTVPPMGSAPRTPLAPLGTPTLLGGSNCAHLTNSNGNNAPVVTNSLSTSALSMPLSGSLLNVDRSSSTNSSSSNSSAPGIQRKTSLKRSNSRKNKENSAYGAAKRTSSGSTISAAVEAQNGTSEGVQPTGSPAAGTGPIVADSANIPSTTGAHAQYKALL